MAVGNAEETFLCIVTLLLFLTSDVYHLHDIYRKSHCVADGLS